MKLTYFMLAVALGTGACADRRNGDEAPARPANTSGPAGVVEAERPGDAAAPDTNPQAGGQVSDADGELPRTASPLTPIGLAGLLALGAAAGCRLLRS